MTGWEYFVVMGGFAAVIWWAYAAKWEQDDERKDE